MPKVVDAEPLKPGFFDRWEEHPKPEGRAPDGPALGCREHESLWMRWIGREVPSQLLGDEAGQGHNPATSCLGGPVVEAPSDFDDRICHGDPRSQEVHSFQTPADDLSESETRVASEEDEGSVADQDDRQDRREAQDVDRDVYLRPCIALIPDLEDADRVGPSAARPTNADARATASHQDDPLKTPHAAPANPAITAKTRTCTIDHTIPVPARRSARKSRVIHRNVVPNTKKPNATQFLNTNISIHPLSRSHVQTGVRARSWGGPFVPTSRGPASGGSRDRASVTGPARGETQPLWRVSPRALVTRTVCAVPRRDGSQTPLGRTSFQTFPVFPVGPVRSVPSTYTSPAESWPNPRTK